MIYTNIQFLRGFAAISVVFFHVLITSSHYGYPADYLRVFYGWGRFGVDLFFVISGFVLTESIRNKNRSAIVFLYERAVRVIPLYWFVTSISIAAVVMLPSQIINTSQEVDFTWLLSSYLFISQLLGFVTPQVYVGWTLEYEALFYIIVALGMIGKNEISFFKLGLILIFASFFLPLTLEFLFGFLISFLKDKPKFRFQAHFLYLGCFFLFMSLIFPSLQPSDSFFDQFYRVLVWGVPSALIVSGVILTKQMRSKFFSLLGDSSYSIYLSQVLFVSFYFKVFSYFRFDANTDLVIIGCVFATSLSGIFMSRLIEKPLLRYFKNMVQ